MDLKPFNNNEVFIPVFYSIVPVKVSISSFEIIKVIGKGAYAIVTQVRKRNTGVIYAMKTIEKNIVIEESIINGLLAEKEILSSVDSPFIAKLNWAFSTKTKLHFVLDFYPGGDLFYHLRNMPNFSEEQTKFYFAEILVGLEVLHNKKIAYRDLKPENIVIDIDGHVRITDFGLSKMNMTENSMSFCGSPEYMSPEVLAGGGHSALVDFYCLGALIYEMLLGAPPFYDKNRNKMFNKILSDKLTFPKKLSKNCKSLIKGLLEKDPNKRLGFNGIKEIINHPWCLDIQWEKIKHKEIEPPLVPNLRKSNFDKEFTNSKVPKDYFSDEEFECDPQFTDFDYNLEVKNDAISKNYFKRHITKKLSRRSQSHDKTDFFFLNKKITINGNSCIENLENTLPSKSTNVSPFFSPTSSPSNSSVKNKTLSLHDLLIKPPRSSKNSGNLSTLNVPEQIYETKGSFFNFGRKSLF